MLNCKKDREIHSIGPLRDPLVPKKALPKGLSRAILSTWDFGWLYVWILEPNPQVRLYDTSANKQKLHRFVVHYNTQKQPDGIFGFWEGVVTEFGKFLCIKVSIGETSERRHYLPKQQKPAQLEACVCQLGGTWHTYWKARAKDKLWWL